MSGKKSIKLSGHFDVTKAVKAAAREHVGQVPATRADPATIEKKRAKKGKHKKTLAKTLAQLDDPGER